VRSGANTDLKVGLTVLIGLALLFYGIYLAKGLPWGGEQNLLHARFPNAGGIEKGDPVFIRGIKHGTVTEISSLASDTDVVLTMSIDQKVMLHEDATATIMMLELMSGKKVDIVEGTGRNVLTAKDTIMGYSPGDLSDLVTLLNSLRGTLPAITRNVDSVLRNLTDFFGNGKFKEKAYSTLDDADETLKELRIVLVENRESLKRTIDQADVLTRELNSTIISMRPGTQALIDSMRTFLRGAGRTLSGADSLLGSLNEMMAVSKDKKSLFYRLTTDKEMANKLDSLLESGHKLIEQIRLQGVDANIRFFQSSKPIK
jgi:phospholipid/cholesterol/gamma-HCH transport system substrate-binding protein